MLEKFDGDRKGVELKQSLIPGRFVRDGYSEPYAFEELVGVLERLTLALKAPEQAADGSDIKALPAGTASEGEKSE